MRQIGEDIWVEPAEQRGMGRDIGARMTIVRSDQDDVWLHSPVPMTEARRTRLERLGTVRWLVAPNRFHHLYLEDWIRAYPDASLWGAPGLSQKRGDLDFDGVLTQDEATWGGLVESMLLEGAPTVSEVLFYHPTSRTIVGADLFFNGTDPDSILYRSYVWVNGLLRRPELGRRLEFEDPDRLRESLRRIFDWDFERVVVAHGAVLERDARRLLCDIFARNFESQHRAPPMTHSD